MKIIKIFMVFILMSLTVPVVNNYFHFNDTHTHESTDFSEGQEIEIQEDETFTTVNTFRNKFSINNKYDRIMFFVFYNNQYLPQIIIPPPERCYPI